MIRVVSFNFQGALYPVFIDDTVSGYSGKDVLRKQGAYEEVVNEYFTLPLAELQGSIDGYHTKCMALLLASKDGFESNVEVQDCTNRVKQLLTVPETAAKMLLSREDPEERQFLETALETIHCYEQTTKETKVFLPESAFEFIDPEVAKNMRSTRSALVLRSSDNQEILQKTPTSVYGVVLPAVEDLHSKVDVSPSALDILRVIAPCRRELTQGVYQYNGIYHTPYYKVDPRRKGTVPSYLDFLYGYHKNDMLGVLPHERHMYDNLRTFVCSDVARYVNEIFTGLLMTTTLGSAIRKLLACHNSELLTGLVTEVTACDINGITCGITYSDLQNTVGETWDLTSMANLVKNSMKFDDVTAMEMVKDRVQRIHVVDIENLPFVLELSDAAKDAIVEVLISSSVITRVMLEHILALCMKAYEVNWGHTGATRAIPRFVLAQSVQAMDEVIGAYLSQSISGIPAPANIDFTWLYETQSRPDDDEEDTDDDDEVFTRFDYYITNDTAMKVRSNTLASDFFTSSATGAETSESSIVEYWRKVNGENELSYFISSAFNLTGNVEVLYESFLKLMRWGEVKPSLLVFQDFPEVRTVFDLNTGLSMPNTAIVDESQLVLSNGCSYSLEGVITANDVLAADKSAIVGFLLSKNYGIKKYFMASWVDIGEMIENNGVDVDAFKIITNVNLTGDSAVDICALSNSGFQFYTSQRNIEQGLKYNIPPADFSELALLTVPGILRSADYLRSKQNTVLVTTRDRQFAILSAYCSALRALYNEEGAALSAETLPTSEVSALAVKVYHLFLDNGKEAAPDVNQARAGQAVKQINLMDDDDQIEYSDAELNGKFAIISDTDMLSNFPAIEFSDAQLQRLAARLRNRIVLLLMETDDSFILCRKDISPNELLVPDHKIEHRRFNVFASVIKALSEGRTVNLSNSKTGVKKPVKLHESLREFM